MKRTCMAKGLCVILSLVLLLSFASCGSGGNRIDVEFSADGSRNVFYNGTMYYRVNRYSKEDGCFYKWDCKDKGFKKMGKCRKYDSYTAYGYEGDDGEVLIIKMKYRGYLWESDTDYYIRKDYYPLDLYEVELMRDVRINNKKIRISEDEDASVTFGSLMETDICFPLLSEDQLTKTDYKITVYSEEFPILSRTFYVYSDEQQNLYVLVDSSYFLKIKEPVIIDRITDRQEKK